MLIDTEAANNRSREPQIVITSRYASQYTESQTRLLEEPVYANDVPPTYLEATTPGLYYGRSSGDEGATLLNCEEQRYKDDTYSGRSFRRSLRTKWTKWLGVLMLIVFVLAAGVGFITSARKDKQVCVLDDSRQGITLTVAGFSDLSGPTFSASRSKRDVGSTKLDTAGKTK